MGPDWSNSIIPFGHYRSTRLLDPYFVFTALHTTMWSALITLLPLTAALQFPHIPSAQEALDAAGSILHPSATLSHASDMVLSSVPTDDHLVITSALHPVSLPPEGALRVEDSS